MLKNKRENSKSQEHKNRWDLELYLKTSLFLGYNFKQFIR